jgi:YHS domain-containing protein
MGEYNLQTAIQTLRWKVRDEVESKQIHGGLLHYWDVYYRQMVTIWLRDVHNSVLEKKESENSKTFYQSQKTGATYYFTDSTWEEIEEYQKHSLHDLIVY